MMFENIINVKGTVERVTWAWWAWGLNFIAWIFANTGNILRCRERIAVLYIYCSMLFFFCCGFECVKNVFRRIDSREILIMECSSLVYFSILMTWKCISVAGNGCCERVRRMYGDLLTFMANFLHVKVNLMYLYRPNYGVFLFFRTCRRNFWCSGDLR